MLAHYESISASGGNLVRYMNQYGRFPAYENTGVRYFPLGDDMFPVLIGRTQESGTFYIYGIFYRRTRSDVGCDFTGVRDEGRRGRGSPVYV